MRDASAFGGPSPQVRGTDSLPPASSEAAKARRAWPAILTLFFLAPITAEVLTASTPILVFVTNPVSFIFNPLLYGCGALLIRELARRRGLGWASILLMGAAYGVFEEGLVINTWADPWAHPVCAIVNGATQGICDYSRVGGINLLWALSLTLFHAIVSITIPILLVELAFPARSARPWLGHKAIVACVASELLCLVLGLILNFADFRTHGRDGPLLAPYLVELALMAVFIALALYLRRRSGPISEHKAPRLWSLRVLGFFALFEVILSPYLIRATHLPFELGLALNLALLGVAVWRVRAWSHRAGWGGRQRLALASGVLGFLLLAWDPFLELSGSAGGQPTRGTALVALAYLIFLIILARRTARRLRERPGSPVWPAPAVSIPVPRRVPDEPGGFHDTL